MSKRDSYTSQRNEAVEVGRELFQRRLVSGIGGNLSLRVSDEHFLLTSSGVSLGFLKASGLLLLDLKGNLIEGQGELSSEWRVHLAIYQNLTARAVIHAHPPMAIAVILARQQITMPTLEPFFCLGKVPIMKMEDPVITEPEPIIEKLRLSNMLIMEDHGTLCIGQSLHEAFLLTDALEEGCKSLFWARQLGLKEAPSLDLKKPREVKGLSIVPLFSSEHVEWMKRLVNQDDASWFSQLSRPATFSLALEAEDTGQLITFHLKEGRIEGVNHDPAADFHFATGKFFWQAIFKGDLNPFVAMFQGRLKVKKGIKAQLALHYKAMERLFGLWCTRGVG